MRIHLKRISKFEGILKDSSIQENLILFSILDLITINDSLRKSTLKIQSSLISAIDI